MLHTRSRTSLRFSTRTEAAPSTAKNSTPRFSLSDSAGKQKTTAAVLSAQRQDSQSRSKVSQA